MFAKSIGIDLGTSNVLVYVKGRGIVLNEPAVVAYTEADMKAIAFGHQARVMIGRAPGRIRVVRPIRDGVVADYLITEAMLRHYIRRVVGRFSLFRPVVMVCIPAGVTNVESRAVLDATLQAGAKEAHLIPEPLAAAIGADIPIDGPSGNMVVDIGGGTTESAVIALNDIVVSNSIRVAGNTIDEMIQTYIRRRHNLVIGERTAEEIKLQIGSAMPQAVNTAIDVRGLNQLDGLPKTRTITSHEITEAMSDAMTAIITSVRAVLEQTPPELASDIADKGIVLTGGGALLRNMDRMLARATGVPAYVADDPLTCVAFGAGRALEHLEVFRDSLTPV
jgi:rod shape-determining protein MreB